MLECCLQSQETDENVWFSMAGSSCKHFTELAAELEGLRLVSKILDASTTSRSVCCKNLHICSLLVNYFCNGEQG